ncbi:MAG: hypothetical protein Q8T04_18060 [Bacteroidota bacterium]|nr:hypothetical protein [Bacteroidota bacterium]
MKLLNKLILPVLLIVVIALIVWRSTRYTAISTPEIKNRLEYALQQAGNNRPELEKVLAHYKNDSLKYRATVFLTENMPEYASEEWGTFRKKQVDTTFSLKAYKNSSEAIRVMDSLQISFSLISRKPDITEVKSAFLINNTDIAFGLWNQPWAKHLTFDEFCEYLLPYRVDREKLEDFHAYLNVRYDSLFQASRKCTSAYDATCTINLRLLKDVRWYSQMALYPGKFTSKKTDQMKIGDCTHLSDYGLKVFRSFGIPIANDYVTAWGNTDGAHSWTVAKVNGMEVPFVACDVQPGEFSFHSRPAKIWRKTFAPQPSGLMYYKSNKQEVPPELEDLHSIDVTHLYYKTIDLDIELTASPPKGNNCAFLCVYNRDRWVPVDWGKISSDRKKVGFKNVNDSLLYCAMFYDWMKLKPASDPFFSRNASIMKHFTPDKNKLVSFKYIIKSKNLDQEYSLFVWDGEWEKIATGLPKQDGESYLVDFKDIPSGGLYKVSDKSRPFWFINRELVRSEPGIPFGLKKLN